MKKNVALILLIVTAIFSTSCHKDPPGSPLVRLIPADLKAYWYFKPGTWWAYRDSAMGKTDTVKVLSLSSYTFAGTLTYIGKNATFEYLGLNTYNTGDGYNYNYWINTSVTGSKYQTETNYAFSSKYKPNGTGDVHACFVYPFMVGNMTFTSYGVLDDSCVVANIFSNYKTNNNVVQINNTHNEYEDYRESKTFFAKSIGIVKYEVPFYNKTDTLISYHIQN